MANKGKDFSSIKTGRVARSIEQATGEKATQAAASSQEIKERQSKLRTQGRKGAKAIRINMAFTPDNYQFLQLYAGATGKSLTEACNEMLEFSRKDQKFKTAVQEKLTELMQQLKL